MATPLSPPRIRIRNDSNSYGIARSLPRDYGASLRGSKDLSFSPPRNVKIKPSFNSQRNHFGGSWDHLESPKHRDYYLGGSWDQLDSPRSNYHFTGSWDQLSSCPADGILTYSSETVKITSPEALITHTLSRPSKRRHQKETLSHEINSSPTGDLSSPRDSVAGAKGLLNEPGQNNCFLNSAVQVSFLMFKHFIFNRQVSNVNLFQNLIVKWVNV